MNDNKEKNTPQIKIEDQTTYDDKDEKSSVDTQKSQKKKKQKKNNEDDISISFDNYFS